MKDEDLAEMGICRKEMLIDADGSKSFWRHSNDDRNHQN
jgi:hypothetical protein